jgi:hypothetical protein
MSRQKNFTSSARVCSVEVSRVFTQSSNAPAATDTDTPTSITSATSSAWSSYHSMGIERTAGSGIGFP